MPEKPKGSLPASGHLFPPTASLMSIQACTPCTPIFQMLTLPMFATLFRAAQLRMLGTCLLEISNVVCPAIFVCLNIGTRQPGP